MMSGLGMGGAGLLWILLLGVAIWAVVGATNRTGTRSGTGSAREVLDGRLASGQLSLDEYKTLRETLGERT